MKKYLIIQGIAAAAILLGNAGIASANTFPMVVINGNRCAASTTVSIPDARVIATYLNLSASQQAMLFNPANLYLTTTPVGSYGSKPLLDLCLQSGYISNVPAGIDTASIFAGSGQPNFYTATTSPYASYSSIYNTSTLFSKGVQAVADVHASSSPSFNSTSSSMTNYTVNVDYSHFAAEATKYGYQSVYLSTGSKSVTITVLKFAGSQNLTAQQAISQLSTLGYRPATLSELYAVGSQAGTNVVGLGTNLESGYGYPITGGTGGAGMSHSNGPFMTVLYKFAAVHK